MSEKKTAVFSSSTWAKGTRGQLGPWATDMPRIQDMRLAIDGSLIPRPRYELYADITGRTSGSSVVFPCRYYSTSSGYLDGMFIGDGSSCGFYQDGSTTALATGSAMSGMDVLTTYSQINSFTWLVGGYVVELKGTTGITVTDAGAALETAFEPGTNTTTVVGSAVHQGRAFYWGNIENASSVLTQANRIWYSDAYDYAVFSSADQYFDVDGDVLGCASVGSNLVIWTITGDWYILQGRGNPADGTLNSLGRNRIPPVARIPSRQDNELYFIASDKTAVTRVTEGGTVDDVSLSHLGFDDSGELWINNGAPNPTASSIHNTVLIPNDDDVFEPNIIHRWNNTWTEENYGGSLTNNNSFHGTNDFTGKEVLSILLSGNWKVYYRDIVADGPIADIGAITHSEEPGGQLDLPRIQANTDYVRVVKVVIDARYWQGDGLGPNPGPYEDPAISVSVGDGKGGTIAFSFGPEDEDLAGLTDGESVPIRLVAGPSSDGLAPFTHFSDVTLSGMLSLAIEKVAVIYETTNSRNF